MGKTIFISYANEAMSYSLKRIGRQARRLGVFDEVRLFTPEDVPDYVKASPLFSCARGAGYWCWKPAIIDLVLQQADEGDVVVYVDAGCTLRKTSEWELFLRLMDRYDTLCFQYDESQPQWAKFGSPSARIKHWTKKKTLDYVRDYFHNPEAGEIPQIMGGVLFMKGKQNRVLSSWKDLIFNHPELVVAPAPEELADQYPFFVAHRHDQSLLTPLAYGDPNTLILPEISEAYRRDSFVWASRVRARNAREYVTIQIKHYLRIWLGDELFEKLKGK